LSREAGWAGVAKLAVRPLGVVGAAEVFDDHPGLGQRPELFAVEAFVAEAAKNATPARPQYRYFTST
jgi:hypothetical protein